MDIECLGEFFNLLNLKKIPFIKTLTSNYLYGFAMLQKENKSIILLFKTVIICVKLCEPHIYILYFTTINTIETTNSRKWLLLKLYEDISRGIIYYY